VDNKIEIRTLPFPFNETKTTVGQFLHSGGLHADAATNPDHQPSTRAPQNIRYANLDFFNPQSVTPNGDNSVLHPAIGTHRLAIGGRSAAKA